MAYTKAFEEYLKGQDKSINTVSCYIRDAKAFINWYNNRTDYGLDKLIELDLVEYKKYMQNGTDSIITINRKIASVNAFLAWLHREGKVEKELSIKPIKNKETRQYKGLDDRELRKLRAEIHRTGDKMHIAIIEILLGTGIRVSELVDLKLDDIEMTDRKGKIAVLGKGNALRGVPLNKDVRKAIGEYLEVRRESADNHLLIGQRGSLNRNAINLILKKYGDRVGIAITPHKLRHTLGYKLVREGKPITTIQQIFGHDNIQSTNIYTLTIEKDKIEALEGLEW
ncbi:tyrosine-type recombinase/integrase [Clostridium formicaceticum]|uniref:Recombinase XerC n=1 Tax=Clostridium formicaceticum TaxID=1497 RepID=A0AAC9RKW5_9CLOT|nr:tyrosine-type recombinase/integrase [Clostridium formicaceticum]AOY76732.1 recombinase XerC [Clostridium formicaceticum]ARE87168.1 Tyrosine recombinase XerC [Clostridium formicaceticum]